ncbi:MAG: hypothetical protein ACYC43_08880 [Burkholderiales bacterium]
MGPELYCLNDTSFIGLLTISENPSDEVRTLVNLADSIMENEQCIIVANTIDSIEIGDTLFFYDLYSADFNDSDMWHGLDRDTLSRLTMLRSRLETIYVNPLAAKLNNLSGQCICVQETSGAAAIANTMADEAKYFVWLLVGPKGGEAGEYSLCFENIPFARIYTIRADGDLSSYARWLIREFSLSEDDFFSLWERAFPSLLKSDDLSFRRFQGTYISLRNDVLNHLAFLNDHFLMLWNECRMDFFTFKTKAKAAYSVDFSNESGNTRKSTKKMNERIAKFMATNVLCELHTKIQPTMNRIHFHPPIQIIGANKILVGIFVDHLPV